MLALILFLIFAEPKIEYSSRTFNKFVCGKTLLREIIKLMLALKHVEQLWINYTDVMEVFVHLQRKS